MASRSLLDQLAQSFGQAITDIREKVVEEGWFGRTTGPQERMSQGMGEFFGQAHHSTESPGISASTEHVAPEAAPAKSPMSWEEIRAKMAQDHGYQPERDIDHDLER